MKLEIITPDKKLFEGDIQSITVPGKKGSFMVLKNHAPIISTLSEGEIEYVTRDYKEESVKINGGVIEVKNNDVIVLAEIF